MNLRTFFVTIVFMLLIPQIFAINEVNAAQHEIESMDIHVFLNEDGSATITETRIATLSEGTENYIVIGNLGKSTIKDFKVSEYGKVYEYMDSWDINKSREEKAFKNGIIKQPWHYELAWGIGDYGKHEYEITYVVTDFIKQLKDSQMVFWQFVNREMNIPPKRVTVTIESSEPITKGKENVWAFGFEGDIFIHDGKIVAESHSPLTRQNYVTILAEFPNGNFGTNDVLDQTFEQVKTTAFVGSDYYEDDSVNYTYVSISVILGLVIISIIFRRFFRKYTKRKKYNGKYYREIPFNGPFYYAYGVLNELKYTKLRFVISAFVLKWIKEGKIKIVNETKKSFIKDKEMTKLHIINNELHRVNESEAQLFEFFTKAARNGVLQPKNFKNWVANNHELITNWKIRLEENSFRHFERAGYLKRVKKKTLGIAYLKNYYTPKMQEFEDRVNMFINYLTDFSLLNEQEPINVEIWDELMIWAAMLGMTEVVYEQFKQLNPTYDEDTHFTRTAIRTAISYSTTMNVAFHSSSGNDRSGGGGGSSSLGGGGGSFGGGIGGGTR